MEENIRSIIIGTGSALPKLVANDVIAADINRLQRAGGRPESELSLCHPEWIQSRTGIIFRPVGNAEETPATLGLLAARRALARARLSPGHIGELIVATCTPDQKVPATAAIMHGLLDLPQDCPACDVNAACSGFLYALGIADLIVRVQEKFVLVVGAEKMTSIANPTDRATRPLLGDGAGAVVLAPSTKLHLPTFLGPQPYGLLDRITGCDGKQCRLIEVPAGGSVRPSVTVEPGSDDHYLRMEGKKVFEWAVTKMVALIGEICRRNRLLLSDIGLIIPHQANGRIIELAAKKLGIAAADIPRRFVVTIERHGNMSGASVPVALDDAVTNGKLISGMRVVFVAFGAGLTWAAQLVRWYNP